MRPILRNILAVIAGFVLGSIVNSALVNIGPSVIPLPEGADVSDMEKLAEAIPTFSPRHFLFPFLGHAIGTLVGAYVAARIAMTHKMTFAIVIGAFFLVGGIVVSFILPAPVWFTAVDLIVAYIPMGLLGGKLAGGQLGNNSALDIETGAGD